LGPKLIISYKIFRKKGGKIYKRPLVGVTGEKLPHPSEKVYFGDHRVPETNKTLEVVGFDKDERDFLFRAYGKGAVLQALALYFGAKENSHRDSKGRENPNHIKSGLVATMESLRTRGQEQTENSIFGEEDIVDVIKGKYSGGRRPIIRVKSSDDEFRLAVIKQLVQHYIIENTT
jgi:hypothetical protein